MNDSAPAGGVTNTPETGSLVAPADFADRAADDAADNRGKHDQREPQMPATALKGRRLAGRVVRNRDDEHEGRSSGEAKEGRQDSAHAAIVAPDLADVLRGRIAGVTTARDLDLDEHLERVAAVLRDARNRSAAMVANPTPTGS